jgi:hypothetical protein
VEIYKDLSEVERAFSELKDVIEMRPIYHRTEARVQAHIFIASLAFLLDRALEKKLKSAGMDLSSKNIDLGNGEHRQSVTQGSRRALTILTPWASRTLIRSPEKRRTWASDTSKSPIVYFQSATGQKCKHGLAPVLSSG